MQPGGLPWLPYGSGCFNRLPAEQRPLFLRDAKRAGSYDPALFVFKRVVSLDEELGAVGRDR